MNTLKNIAFICFLLCSFNCLSQVSEYSDSVVKLVNLGRDSIIQIAIERINNEYPNDQIISESNFANIRIESDGKQILVSFSNNIIFLPPNSCYYIGATKGLIDKDNNIGTGNSRSLVSNPKKITSSFKRQDKFGVIPFYIHTDSSKLLITEIKNVTVKYDSTLNIFDFNDDSKTIYISDKKKHYVIESFTSKEIITFSVSKKTMKLTSFKRENIEDSVNIMTEILRNFQEVEF